MNRIIAITSGKGGVGKSTLTANLGVCLAERGLRVALVDMDMGLRSLDILLGLENKIVYDLADVCDGMCRAKQALVRFERAENLVLLPAAQTRDAGAVTPRQLEKTFQTLREKFDCVLVDSPAGIGKGFRDATACADEAVIVLTPDVVAARDAERVASLLERQGTPRPRVAFNRVRPEQTRKLSSVNADEIRERLNLDLLALIPEDPLTAEYAARGTPAALAKGSASGAAYRRAAARLVGEEIPFEAIRRAGFFARLLTRMGRGAYRSGAGT